MKLNEIYRSKMHLREKSHDMVITKDPKGSKLKMTYECYGGLEKFTGEVWTGIGWEQAFTLMDLNESVEPAMYIQSGDTRTTRAEKLFTKGKYLFDVINN